MKIKWIIILLVLRMASQAAAEMDWIDKTLAGIDLSLAVTDAYQTSRIPAYPNLEESNPLCRGDLGPVVILTSGVAIVWLANKVDNSKLRKGLLVLYGVTRFLVVKNNYDLGIR